MAILILNIIISAILTGVILITQIVNYPLFKYVKSEFSPFHKQYVKWIGFVVAPIMITELVIVSIMLIQDWDNILIQLIAILLFIIWLSTFFIQVPIHNELSLSNKKNLNLLIYSNWIRTICWVLKLVISTIIII